MPPCCHIPPQNAYLASLQADCLAFSGYVAGHPPHFPPFAPYIVSALHAEMKLWHAHGVLPVPPYRVNAIDHNSWRAARPQLVRANHFGIQDRNDVFEQLHGLHFIPSGCAMWEYDQMILQSIVNFRDIGLAQPGAVPGAGPIPPTALATIGLSQKLVNIFLKYSFCWTIAAPVHAPVAIGAPAWVNMANVICAPHAPIDSILLRQLWRLPLGRALAQRGLIRMQGGPHLLQCDGAFAAWSRLRCLRTYYGFQMVMRRLAMETWPTNCACDANLQQMRRRANETYDAVADQDVELPPESDWLEAAFDIDQGVFIATIDAMGV